MKRAVILLLVCALSAMAGVQALSETSCGCTFVVNTPSHVQVLGGNSGMNSHPGLHTAADHSGVVIHVPG